MTAFQWDTALTKHLPEKLEGTDASLVLAAFYDRLMTYKAADARWSNTRPDERWMAREDSAVIDPHLRRQVTLLDFLEERVPVVRRRWRIVQPSVAAGKI